MQLSIVIPTWDNSAWTLRCLSALKRRTKMSFEIIWIDNGSTDAHHNAVLRVITQFTHRKERHRAALGFPGSINRGLKLVRGDYVVLLNNDVEVLPDWDTELAAALARGKGGAGPVAIQQAGWQAIQHHPWLGLNPKDRDLTRVHSYLRSHWRGQFKLIPARATQPGWRNMLAFFCVMFNREVITKIGLLDPRFGWGFGDDDDYCTRMRKAGYKLWLCPGAVVFHSVSVTMKRIPGGVQPQLRKAGILMREKYR